MTTYNIKFSSFRFFWRLHTTGFTIAALTLSSCGTKEFDPVIGKQSGSDDSTSDQTGENQEKGSSEETFKLTDCGIDVNNQTGVNVSASLTMNPIVKKYEVGGLFRRQVDVSFLGKSVIESNLKNYVTSFSSSTNSTMTSDDISSTLRQLKGVFEGTLIDVNDRAAIGQTYKNWAGVFCSLQPSKNIVLTQLGRISIDLLEPIPVGVSTLLDFSRAKAELGVKREWSRIEGKVNRSEIASIAEGSILALTVSNEPIKFEGNTAEFKLSYSVEKDGKTIKIGFPDAVTYSIDTSSKSIGKMGVIWNKTLSSQYLKK